MVVLVILGRARQWVDEQMHLRIVKGPQYCETNLVHLHVDNVLES